MGTNHTSERFFPQKDPKQTGSAQISLKTHTFIEKSTPLAVMMPLETHGYVKIDRKLFLSVNVSKYIPFVISKPQKFILPKPEVSQKCKNWDISFKMAFKFSKSV